MERDLGPDRGTDAVISQANFDPLLLPKKAAPKYRGWRGQQIDWGLVLSPKVMILQGVKYPITYLGACHANTPNVEGMHLLAPSAPCASTAVVPENQAKQRFNTHPMLRQGRACT